LAEWLRAFAVWAVWWESVSTNEDRARSNPVASALNLRRLTRLAIFAQQLL